MPVDLEPYRTQTVDYLFYFPRPGKFTHFPAHVAKSEKRRGRRPGRTFEVLEKPRSLDTASWDYVSQFGTDDEVLRDDEPRELQRAEPRQDRVPHEGPGVLREGDRAPEGAARVQRDAVVVRPVPQRPGRGEGVPRATTTRSWPSAAGRSTRRC